jgi:hypothetical protein
MTNPHFDEAHRLSWKLSGTRHNCSNYSLIRRLDLRNLCAVAKEPRIVVDFLVKASL